MEAKHQTAPTNTNERAGDARTTEDLLAVYAIERQDQQHSASMAWTLVGTALVYAGIVTTLMSQADSSSPALLAAAPAPVVAIVSFLTGVVGNVLQRAEYLLDLEAELRGRLTSLKDTLPVPDGFRRSEWIFNSRLRVNSDSVPTTGHAISWFILGTVAFSELGFVGFVLRELFIDDHCWWAGGALGIYGLAISSQLLGAARFKLRPPLPSAKGGQ